MKGKGNPETEGKNYTTPSLSTFSLSGYRSYNHVFSRNKITRVVRGEVDLCRHHQGGVGYFLSVTGPDLFDGDEEVCPRCP